MRFLPFLCILLAARLVSSLESQQEARLSSQNQNIRVNLFRRGSRSQAERSSSESHSVRHHGSRSQFLPIHSPQQSPKAASSSRVSADLESSKEQVSLASHRLSTPLLQNNKQGKSARASGWSLKNFDLNPSNPSSSLVPPRQPSSPKNQQSLIRGRISSGLAIPVSNGSFQREESAVQAQQQQGQPSPRPWSQQKHDMNSGQRQSTGQRNRHPAEQKSNKQYDQRSQGHGQAHSVNPSIEPHTQFENSKTVPIAIGAAIQHQHSETQKIAVNAVKQLVLTQANAIEQHKKTISRLRCMGQALCIKQGVNHDQLERIVQEGITRQSLRGQTHQVSVQLPHDLTQHLVNNALRLHRENQQQQARRLDLGKQQQQLQQPMLQQRPQLELRQQQGPPSQQPLRAQPLLTRLQPQRLFRPQPQRPQPQRPWAQLQPQQGPQLQQQSQLQERPQLGSLQATLQVKQQQHQQPQLQQSQAQLSQQQTQGLLQLNQYFQYLRTQLPQLQRPQAQSQVTQGAGTVSTVRPPAEALLASQDIQRPQAPLPQAQSPIPNLQPGPPRAQFPSAEEMRRYHIMQQANIDNFIRQAPFRGAARADSDEESSSQGGPTKRQKRG